MPASPAPPPRPEEFRTGLTDDLTTLAGTPDDDSRVRMLLRSIAQFSADLLPPVSYASVTVHEKDSYATVAMSSQLALAVDDAQYQERAGPCLDALQTSRPTAVPRIDRTVKWPNFRAAALRLGLHASLSVPLFAGRGTTIAALNLYGHDISAMAPLCAAVLAIYEEGAGPDRDDLGAGTRQLIDGLTCAFEVRSRIQQALGMIMAAERVDADFAYSILRSRAANGSRSLTAAAASILPRTGGEQRER